MVLPTSSSEPSQITAIGGWPHDCACYFQMYCSVKHIICSPHSLLLDTSSSSSLLQFLTCFQFFLSSVILLYSANASRTQTTRIFVVIPKSATHRATWPPATPSRNINPPPSRFRCHGHLRVALSVPLGGSQPPRDPSKTPAHRKEVNKFV